MTIWEEDKLYHVVKSYHHMNCLLKVIIDTFYNLNNKLERFISEIIICDDKIKDHLTIAKYMQKKLFIHFS